MIKMAREPKQRTAVRKQPLFEPWAPPINATEAQVTALKLLEQGKAGEYQQKIALDFIIRDICGYYEEQFCPGEDGRRATDYALGKRGVAANIMNYLRTDMSRFEVKQPTVNT